MNLLVILAGPTAIACGVVWRQYWRGDPEWWVFLLGSALLLAGSAVVTWLTF